MLMKRRAIIFSCVFVMSALFVPKTYAAGCATATNLGTAEVKVANLPASGVYSIWSRMQAPDSTHNRYVLEVNGEGCFTVGGGQLTTDKWVWVDYQGGDTNAKISYDFTKTTGNSLKLIGTDANVKIDSLLLIKSDCVPVDLGENCKVAGSVVTLTPATPWTSIEGEVAGKVITTSKLTNSQALVANVQYFSDGKKIQTSRGAEPLDTTLLSNGKHTITTRITDTSGQISDELVELNVKNEETLLTPVYRWSRLNKRLLIIILAPLVLILLGLATFWVLRNRHDKHKTLRERGF